MRICRYDMNRNKTIEDECYYIGLGFAGLGLIGCFIYFKFIVPILPDSSCFFWKVFGLYCPGCGGTRAVDALLHGHILQSLWYHPLVIYTVVVFGGFMLTNTMRKLHILHIKGWKFHAWQLYGALVIVLCNWILKNILLLCYHITL